jgi:hypothetical protein
LKASMYAFEWPRKVSTARLGMFTAFNVALQRFFGPSLRIDFKV